MSKNIAIIIPVFNDWPALSVLVRQIDQVMANENAGVSLIIVDDGSTGINKLNLDKNTKPRSINSIKTLRLACNLGHQRAIAIGLVYASKLEELDAVIVMDGDGEDMPGDLISLMNAYQNCGAEKIIVAKREKRSEGLLFRASYLMYKLIFRVLTGNRMDFGNFCLIPVQQLSRLIYKDTLWNHFAATVLQSKVPISLVSTERGERIDGEPVMNFTGLVIHGLSSISVFVDQVLVRTIVFLTCAMLILIILGILGMVLTGVSSEFIPGVYSLDMTTTVSIFLVLSFFTYVLILRLSRRSQKMIIPAVDMEIYIKNVDTELDTKPDA